jgi:hemoglobin
MQAQDQRYGVGANSYRAAGELAGLTRLVDDFYDNMDRFPEARVIRAMHPPDISETRRKLTYFLCGWLGGPRLYNEHYGPISIPGFHQPLPIAEAERDAWLLCMEHAIAAQPYEPSFKQYLLDQLRIPAERIRFVCAASRAG